MELKPGMRLQSTTCATQVIVVRAPKGDVDLRCGGHPMSTVGGEAAANALEAGHSGGTLTGKRYGDDDMELLCTKPGAGSLSVGESPINPKDAKLLPSSD
jgi:hypothetical protein